MNFTFTILDEGRKAFSVDGNYCLAIQVEESYKVMKAVLSDICKEVEMLHSIEIDKQKFNVGGDWKFLALVTG